jgi:hypothetical protein
MSRTGTVALVVRRESGCPILVDQISDDDEILQLESSIRGGDCTALEDVYLSRDQRAEEEERFGDFVEALITQPFVKPDVLEHGVQWLRSKLRIEKFQRSEREATRVIAQYAFQVYSENPELTDFLLSGPHAQVRIRILELPVEKKGAA